MGWSRKIPRKLIYLNNLSCYRTVSLKHSFLIFLEYIAWCIQYIGGEFDWYNCWPLTLKWIVYMLCPHTMVRRTFTMVGFQIAWMQSSAKKNKFSVCLHRRPTERHQRYESYTWVALEFLHWNVRSFKRFIKHSLKGVFGWTIGWMNTHSNTRFVKNKNSELLIQWLFENLQC